MKEVRKDCRLGLHLQKMSRVDYINIDSRGKKIGYLGLGLVGKIKD